MQADKAKNWQAVLVPHRSLSREGFVAVMALIALVNLVVGGLFMTIGAWPVAGFAGLDVLLIWWAFRANFADARKLERIRITDHELVFDRVFAGQPPEQQRFVRRWVRVELDEDRERELVGSLALVSGQTRVNVGAFLNADERRTLAGALRKALAIPRI